MEVAIKVKAKGKKKFNKCSLKDHCLDEKNE